MVYVDTPQIKMNENRIKTDSLMDDDAVNKSTSDWIMKMKTSTRSIEFLNLLAGKFFYYSVYGAWVAVSISLFGLPIWGIEQSKLIALTAFFLVCSLPLSIALYGITDTPHHNDTEST